MAQLADTLWYERRLLECLLFKLVSANLVLIADDRRFVGPAIGEVDAVMAEIRKAESRRGEVVAAVAREWNVPPEQVGLAFLVKKLFFGSGVTGFTAIIVAMTLIFLSSALGLLDYNLVWVPPTYLWPGIVGGLIMGVGFIVGGFWLEDALLVEAFENFKFFDVEIRVGIDNDLKV